MLLTGGTEPSRRTHKRGGSAGLVNGTPAAGSAGAVRKSRPAQAPRIGERRPRPVGQRHVGRGGGTVAVRVHPVEPPLEGAHDAVVGAGEQTPFPGVEEAGEHSLPMVPEGPRTARPSGHEV